MRRRAAILVLALLPAAALRPPAAAGAPQEPEPRELRDIGFDHEREALKDQENGSFDKLELIVGSIFIFGVVIWGFLRWQAELARRRRR